MAWIKPVIIPDTNPTPTPNPDPVSDILNYKKIAIGGASSAATGRTPEERNYWEFIAERTGVELYDTAASGSTLTSPIEDYLSSGAGSNLLKQISWMSSSRDAVVVQVGANDENNKKPLGTFESTSPTEFYGALHIMCKNLLDKFPLKPKGVLTSQYYSPVNARTSEYQDAIKEVCGYYGIPVCDLRKEGQTPYTYYAWQAQHAPDGIHLIESGDLILSYRVESFLRSLFGY